MKSERVSNFLLAVIALALVINIFIAISEPQPAQAGWGAKFDHLQFSGGMGGFWILDTKTGEIWTYEGREKTWRHHGKLVELGQPLVK